MTYATFMRVRVSWLVLNAWLPETLEPVGEGVSELRIDYGPGYRVYSTMREHTVIILLAGGDKRTQAVDIKSAYASRAICRRES